MESFKKLLRKTRIFYLKLRGVNIDLGSEVSLFCSIDLSSRNRIYIGKETYITSGVTILTHDKSRRLIGDVIIGDRVFVGINTIILPGIKIGDNCIIGAGSVVTKDIPSNTLGAGNPCVALKSIPDLGKHGVFIKNPERRNRQV